jgi:hypothetical protein
MDEVSKLAELCRRLGAPSQQAETMARQLLKRADQLAVERNQSREACLDYLLRLVMKGSAGELPPEFAPKKE